MKPCNDSILFVIKHKIEILPNTVVASQTPGNDRPDLQEYRRGSQDCEEVEGLSSNLKLPSVGHSV